MNGKEALMKRIIIPVCIMIILSILLTACQKQNMAVSGDAVETNQETQTTEKAENQTEGGYDLSKKEFNVRITVGDTQLMATLENNATTQYLVQQMPLTLPMEDLYDREMCYRYGANALPVEHLQTDAYEVGDLAYWAPGGSVMILYRQNGEKFERQHLGHIDSGVDVFENTGNANVTFELVTE